MIALLAILSLLQSLTTAFNNSTQYCPRTDANTQLQASPIYQFALGSNLENIVVSSSGKLLVTRSDVPELWQIDPLKKEAELLTTFPRVTGLSGIAEIRSNEYAVISGNLSVSDPSTVGAGSFSVWRVTVGHGSTIISQIASIPQARLLNDIEPLKLGEGLFLISDSFLGVVYRLDVRTGEVVQVIDDPSMKPTSELVIGINGIAVHADRLHFSNSARGTFYRLSIDPATGQADGEVEAFAKTVIDDFVFDVCGIIYAAGDIDNEVLRISPTGKIDIIAGSLNSTNFAGDTSVAFGRTSVDSNVLYVTTSGAQYAPVNGTFVEGAKVVALDLSWFNRNHVKES